jgi:hypothetical protein
MIEGGDTKRSRRCHPGIIRAFTRNPQSDQSRASPHQGGAFADVMNATLRLCVLRPPLRLANLRLAQAFADVCECTTGDAAQPACCVLGLALFIDPASLEFRKPSAEFGQLGRREPQDRFFDIFDCHGRKNSTALELEEQWPSILRSILTPSRLARSSISSSDILSNSRGPQGHARVYRGQPRHSFQRAYGRRRPDRFRPCLPAGPRRHRVEG